MTRSGLLGRYREVLAIPHLPGMLFWALAGRLHLACSTLVMTFLVAGWTGSYTLAGIVAGALTVCQGVAGPWRGRSADRGHADRLVVVTSLCYAAGLVGLAALPTLLPPAGWPLAVVLAALTGFALPPVNQIARAGWPRLVPPTLRDSVYTADATLQELLFVIGPVAVAATVALAGAASGTLLVASFVLVGGMGFAVVLRRAGLAAPLLETPAPTSPGAGPGTDPGTDLGTRKRSVLAEPGLATLIVVMGLLVGGLIATDLVIIGWARERGEPFLAGVLAAVWAVGSLLGGLVVGARPAATPPRLGIRLGAGVRRDGGTGPGAGGVHVAGAARCRAAARWHRDRTRAGRGVRRDRAAGSAAQARRGVRLAVHRVDGRRSADRTRRRCVPGPRRTRRRSGGGRACPGHRGGDRLVHHAACARRRAVG